MSAKPITISVGIPVYNEEGNIVSLIESVFNQKLNDRFIFDMLFVYDDNSKDSTRDILKNVKSNRIKLLLGSVNKGKATGLQSIFDACTSDILITIDSDIQFGNLNLLNDFVVNQIEKDADLVNGWYTYTEDSYFYGKSFSFSADLLEAVARQNPFYGVWGGIMGFKKSLYKAITLPEKLYRIDGYLYLTCLSLDMHYHFLNDMKVLDPKDFKNMNAKDYKKIIMRSNSFPDNYLIKFDEKVTHRALSISKLFLLKVIIKCSIRKPGNFIAYSVTRLVSILKRNTSSGSNVLWRN